MQINSDAVLKKLSCCGFVEKFIPARIAKQKAVDKIMDKPWKTLKGFPHLTHNFAHNLQQAILSHNKLYHKLHNNYCRYKITIKT
jgi:hypothetical protein